jgi:helicase
MVQEVVSQVLKLNGFASLNPAQQAALDAGLLENKNMVVAAPTASGKTLTAEIAALDTLNKGKKVVYIVPLKALASEKHHDFKEKFEPLGYRVAISVGDLDSSDQWLADYDLIIVTSEKMDSLLRHEITWSGQIGLVIADEIHLLNDPGRGPTLEMVLTRLRQVCNPKILGLSATISNHKELAEWLDANAVKSDYRPVKLYSGVYFENAVSFHPKRELGVKIENPLDDLVQNTLNKKKQLLIFVSTRRSAEAVAENTAKLIKYRLDQADHEKLAAVAEEVLHLEQPTRQCIRLADCVRAGTAFHHAGLTHKQREAIEKAFKDGIIKMISATPTLAAGINMPAYRVIIRDLKRFSSFRGNDYIPVLEIQQMAGRAGRPKYDEEGEAILIAKNKAEAKYAWERYVHGEPEDISSKLGVEPVLRTHVLALIASGIVTTREELYGFFSKTFYAHQYKDLSEINRKLDRILIMLKEFRFITTGEESSNPFVTASSMAGGNEIQPTRIGKRVSELYIDPLTANAFTKSLEAAQRKGTSHFGYLHTICDTIEMSPQLGLRKNDFTVLNELMAEEEKNLLKMPPSPWDLEYDSYMRSLKTAAMLREWTQETTEDNLLETFGVTPGELRVRLSNADWLLYSLQELGLLLAYKDQLSEIRKTRLRVKYGIAEELLNLIKLKGIGRARARKLYAAGIKTTGEISKVPVESLKRLLGPKTAEEVLKQV